MASIVLTIVVLTVAWLLIRLVRTHLRYWRQRQHLKDIPGPRSHWFYGNAKLFINPQTGRPCPKLSWKVLLELTKDYDGIYKLTFGPEPFVHIFKANYIEALLSSSKLIEKGSDYNHVRQWLGDGLLTSKGAKWRSHRKLLTPAFHFKVLEEFIPIMNDQSMKLRSKLEGSSETIFNKIAACTLDIILETSMGFDMKAQDGQDNRYLNAIHRYGELIMVKLMDPILSLGPLFQLSSYGFEYRSVIKGLQDFTRSFIRKRKAEIISQNGNVTSRSKDSKRKPFLDLILDLHLNEGSNLISEEEVREQVDTFTFGGHDTTGVGLTYILWNIGRFPHVQERIHAELDEIFGDDVDRPVTKEDIQQMSYIEATIKESMRLYPPVPMVLRELADDLVLSEKITLQKGIQVGIPIFLTHRDPEQWDRPLEFDPERFLDDSSKSRHPFSYIPFSGGPRNCIGQKYAQLEEKIVVANVLRKYQLRSLDTEDKLEVAMEIVLRPKGPVRIEFTPRK